MKNETKDNRYAVKADKKRILKIFLGFQNYALRIARKALKRFLYQNKIRRFAT
jgi:hypothetical protein